MLVEYNITSGAWSLPSPLFNSPTEMVTLEMDSNNVTTNATDADVQISVHSGKFLITWQRNRVCLSLFILWIHANLFVFRLDCIASGPQQ